jgi:hypothetical protein
MADNPNLERLRDVLIGDPPSDDHLEVIKGLTPEEVDVIIAVTERLKWADSRSGIDPGRPEGLPAFAMFMPF